MFRNSWPDLRIAGSTPSSIQNPIRPPILVRPSLSDSANGSAAEARDHFPDLPADPAAKFRRGASIGPGRSRPAGSAFIHFHPFRSTIPPIRPPNFALERRSRPAAGHRPDLFHRFSQPPRPIPSAYLQVPEFLHFLLSPSPHHPHFIKIILLGVLAPGACIGERRIRARGPSGRPGPHRNGKFFISLWSNDADPPGDPGRGPILDLPIGCAPGFRRQARLQLYFYR